MHPQESAVQTVSNWQKVWIVVAPFVLISMVWMQWNEVAGSASVIHSRLFFVGWAVVGFVMVGSIFLKPHWGQLRDRLLVANVASLALYIGLAIGTTDWANWPLERWWQAWGTVPLLMGVLPLIRDISNARD